MGMPEKELKRAYTFGDYLKWGEDERWEIIDGQAYDMSPSPSRRHQAVSGELYRQIVNYLQDKVYEVYSAPFDVRLPEDNEDDNEIRTVVQPDIVVVCDMGKLDDKGCRGAPDMFIKVVSPHTIKKTSR